MRFFDNCQRGVQAVSPRISPSNRQCRHSRLPEVPGMRTNGNDARLNVIAACESEVVSY